MHESIWLERTKKRFKFTDATTESKRAGEFRLDALKHTTGGILEEKKDQSIEQVKPEIFNFNGFIII